MRTDLVDGGCRREDGVRSRRGWPGRRSGQHPHRHLRTVVGRIQRNRGDSLRGGHRASRLGARRGADAVPPRDLGALRRRRKSSQRQRRRVGRRPALVRGRYEPGRARNAFRSPQPVQPLADLRRGCHGVDPYLRHRAGSGSSSINSYRPDTDRPGSQQRRGGSGRCECGCLCDRPDGVALRLGRERPEQRRRRLRLLGAHARRVRRRRDPHPPHCPDPVRRRSAAARPSTLAAR